MSAKNYLEFSEFTQLSATAQPVKVYANGIEIDGQRFNGPALQKFRGHVIYAALDEDALGVSALCFEGRDEQRWFICSARPKRKYDDQISTFCRALDVDANAIRKLNQWPGWHGQPWYKHLASVLWNVMTEPPMKALPWKGGAL